MKLNLSIVTLIGLTLTGCFGGGGGPSESAAQLFVDKLNNIDISYYYQLVKETTARGGDWIVVSKSTYYTNCYYDVNNVYQCDIIPVVTNNFAVNFSDPTRASYNNDANFFTAVGLGVGYNFSTGLYFDAYGNTYQKQGGVIKDLNVLGAKAEEVRRAVYASELQTHYGLSNERSLSLAKMGMDLRYLAKKNGGSVSAKDAAAFEKFAFGGVKIKSMVEHMQAGDQAALKKDKETIGAANGLTADDVSHLMLQFQ